MMVKVWLSVPNQLHTTVVVTLSPLKLFCTSLRVQNANLSMTRTPNMQCFVVQDSMEVAMMHCRSEGSCIQHAFLPAPMLTSSTQAIVHYCQDTKGFDNRWHTHFAFESSCGCSIERLLPHALLLDKHNNKILQEISDICMSCMQT